MVVHPSEGGCVLLVTPLARATASHLGRGVRAIVVGI